MERLKAVRLGVAAAAIFLGGASLYLSVPVIVGDLLLKPGNDTLRRIQARQSVTPEGIETLIDSRKQALGWWDSERVWTDLGLAHLVFSAWEDEKSARHQLESARETLRRGLAMGPASPYVWTRLAYVNYLLEGSSPEMVSALRMALITGPNEIFISHVRFELGLLAWSKLEDTDRALVERQAKRAWNFRPHRTLEIARARKKIDVLRRALKNSQHLRAFEEMLERS